MGIEIERKFLVTSDAWRAAAHEIVPMAQGYLNDLAMVEGGAMVRQGSALAIQDPAAKSGPGPPVHQARRGRLETIGAERAARDPQAGDPGGDRRGYEGDHPAPAAMEPGEPRERGQLRHGSRRWKSRARYGGRTARPCAVDGCEIAIWKRGRAHPVRASRAAAHLVRRCGLPARPPRGTTGAYRRHAS